MNISKVGFKNTISLTPTEGLELCSDLLRQINYASSLKGFACCQFSLRAIQGKRTYAEVLQFNIDGSKDE